MGPRRARLWLSAAAVAGYLPLLGVPFRRWLDFSAFYAGGQLAFQPALLDPLAVVVLQASEGLPPTPFVSPPFVAIPYAVLAALPFDIAALVQVALMTAALLVGAALWAEALGLPRRWALLGTLAWGPASAGIASGQIDALALLGSGFLATRVGGRSSFGAGAVTALLAFKPQVAVGIGIGMVRRLGWRGWAALLVVGGVLYVAGSIATGGDASWPLRWIETIRAYSAADFTANGWQASSPVSLGLRASLAVGGPVPVGVGMAVAVGVAGVALWRWSAPSGAIDLALWAAIGLVISPHAWVYDATLLLPALGALAVLATRLGWTSTDRALFVAAYAIGASWPFGGFIGITLVPLVVVGIPLRLAWACRRAASARTIGLLGHVIPREPEAIVSLDSPS